MSCKWLNWRTLSAVFLCAVLTACGGGGGGSETNPPTEPPATSAPPAFDQSPVSQTVTAGASVTFSVTLKDAAGASYQWLRQGVEVPGATQPSYVLAQATTNDSGSRWSVRARNAGGTTVSADAELTVLPAPPEPTLSLVTGDQGGIGSLDGTGRWARFRTLSGIATDAMGNVYAADPENFTVRKIAPDGMVSTVAGTSGESGTQDGKGQAARFSELNDVTATSDGVLYVADGTRVRRIDPQGNVSTLTTSGLPAARSIAVDKQGMLIISSGSALYTLVPGGTPKLDRKSVV